MAIRRIPKAATGWWRILYFQAYFFYPPVLGILIYRTSTKLSLEKLSLTLLAGLMLWMVIEYLLHRFVFHSEDNGQWWSLLPWAHHTHHKHPREISLILSPVWFSLPISLVVWALLRLIMGDWNLSFLLMAGIWIGYLWYEFVHYTAHCRLPRTRLMKYLKTYHLLHHHTSDPIWFGVTSPFIDRITGTYRQLPGKAKTKVTAKISLDSEQKYLKGTN